MPLTIVAGNKQGFGSPRKLRAAFSRADTNFTEVNADVVIAIPISLHASKVIYNMFVARRAYQVTQIDWVGDIAQAVTGTVVKAVGTATPASATTPMHTAAGVVCNTAAHTVLPIALTTTAADLVLATGDRIAFVLGVALSTGSGTIVLRMKRV